MQTYTPEVNQLIQKMKVHHAWFGNITGEEAEKILKSYPLHTFLLRTGEHDLHYFFSYVTHDSLVFHKSIRINVDAAGYYPNQGANCDPNNTYTEIEPLIFEFLECSEEDLRPLSREIAQVQGF